MKATLSASLLGVLSIFAITPAHAAPPAAPAAESIASVAGYPAANAPVFAVKTILVTWHDDARDRDVPAKIYYPTPSKSAATFAPLPVIIFSHGLGGSREGYSYVGEYWAAHGYVCVHLQHLGSDEAIWKDAKAPMAAVKRAAADPDNARNRPLDVKFALDRITLLNTDATSPLKGRLDLAHIGLAGHSFGAFTTMTTVNPGGLLAAKSYDPRIKAAIAMSTPAAKRPEIYEGIKIPVYHLTGTADTDPVGGATDPKQRRLPYDKTKSASAALLTFEGGDHGVFSGDRRRGKVAPTDARYFEIIQRSTLAFWDAQLKSDATARKWFYEGGLAAALGKDGVFEHKN